jgi:hypothetical protein
MASRTLSRVTSWAAIWRADQSLSRTVLNMRFVVIHSYCVCKAAPQHLRAQAPKSLSGSVRELASSRQLQRGLAALRSLGILVIVYRCLPTAPSAGAHGCPPVSLTKEG